MGKRTGFRIVEHTGKHSTEHARKPKGTRTECTESAFGTHGEMHERTQRTHTQGIWGPGVLVPCSAWRNVKKTLVNAQGMKWENAGGRSPKNHRESRRIWRGWYNATQGGTLEARSGCTENAMETQEEMDEDTHRVTNKKIHREFTTIDRGTQEGTYQESITYEENMVERSANAMAHTKNMRRTHEGACVWRNTRGTHGENTF